MAIMINQTNKEQISSIINSIIEMIKSPDLSIVNNAYFYHPNAKNIFVLYLYIFKLTINNNEYLENKYNEYLKKYPNSNHFDIKKVTDIDCSNELDLLLKIKDKINLTNYKYNEDEQKIIFDDETYVDCKWFLTFISIILDNTKNNENKEINICYTIPNKDISKIKDPEEKNNFLSQFRYYSIRVRHTDNSKPVRENNILIIKNAAVNYLKHLKQFKHGFETEESYLIFYNLLKNECRKEGFELIENELCLLDADKSLLNKIENLMDEEFYKSTLNKQVHMVENIIWQSSNDITLLEQMNNSIDSLIDLLTIIRIENKMTYQDLKKEHNINDIQILLILITNQFLLTYFNNSENLDYSLLEFNKIKPKYMNSIYRSREHELKNRLKNLDIEFQNAKKDLEKYKKERRYLDKDELGQDKYQKELERCVGNINSVSIIIGRLNSTISSLSKEYESLKKEQEKKYRNVDLYNYNHSIIKHLCNSILGCSFYLKTNNTSSIFNNIIIFEDYEKTDNSFYLEITFKDLLKISNQYLLNGIADQSDLPKLA